VSPGIGVHERQERRVTNVNQISPVRVYSCPIEGCIGTYVVPEAPIISGWLEDQRVGGCLPGDLPDTVAIRTELPEGIECAQPELVITEVSGEAGRRPEGGKGAPCVRDATTRTDVQRADLGDRARNDALAAGELRAQVGT
jgi:hypothetical protein